MADTAVLRSVPDTGCVKASAAFRCRGTLITATLKLSMADWAHKVFTAKCFTRPLPLLNNMPLQADASTQRASDGDNELRALTSPPSALTAPSAVVCISMISSRRPNISLKFLTAAFNSASPELSAMFDWVLDQCDTQSPLMVM